VLKLPPARMKSCSQYCTKLEAQFYLASIYQRLETAQQF